MRRILTATKTERASLPRGGHAHIGLAAIEAREETPLPPSRVALSRFDTGAIPRRRPPLLCLPRGRSLLTFITD